MAKKRRSSPLTAVKRAQKGQQQKKQQARELGVAASVPRSILKDYPQASLTELLVPARQFLLQHFISSAPDQVALLKPLCLFFSFTDGLTRAHVVHFAGESLDDVWQKLGTWQQIHQTKTAHVRWLRIDWVTSTAAMSWQELQDKLRLSKRNYFRYGISLDTDFDRAFLEQELNANAMLYLGGKDPQAGLNADNFVRYGKGRYGKGFQLPENPQQPVLTFTTQGFLLQPEQPPVPLNGYTGGSEGRDTGRRPIEKLNVNLVKDLIEQSSQFLAEQVGSKGRFVYGLYPCFDREINTYNTLRHTSTTYAMLEAWEITQNPELKAAIDRSLDYLTKQLIRIYPTTDGDTLAYLVDENSEIKLGGNAVCLLALVKYTELTSDRQFLPLLNQLALGIQCMQDTDSGQMVHVLNAHDLRVKETFRIIYYDGEAAFGLMRLYGLTKDERWLRTVVKAFDYFIAKKHWQSHDHWLSYCVNELTIYLPEERYYQFGIQNVAGYLGFVTERITTFPTLLELMMAAHKMISRLKTCDAHRHLLKQLDLDEFYRALETRAHYLLNGFFWPECAIYFHNPQRILGSFFIRHHSFRVRIDDVEHYLSGFVAYLQHYLRPPSSIVIKPQPTGTHFADSNAQHWNAWHVSRATAGYWKLPPFDTSWHANGLSFARSSMQAGHMVVLRADGQKMGILAEQLHLLPHKPSSLIFEEPEPAGLPDDIPRYQVPSVYEAILNFGRYARRNFTSRVIGVTGSAGKTSSVKLLEAVLSYWGGTGASRLSANVPHGIAWNLASMDWRAHFQVVEMAIGRMATNSELVSPDVAVFLNVGPAHLEYHKTTEQIAIKKSRIFDAMQPAGYAVINRDMDEWTIVAQAAQRKQLRVISFGTHTESNIRWVNPTPLTFNDDVEVEIEGKTIKLSLRHQGAHRVMNILAAFGVLTALDLPYQEVLPQLDEIKAVEGRGHEWVQTFRSGSVLLVDDAYNANPLSMKAMLDHLRLREVAGQKHLILGDMLELGKGSSFYHQEIVPYIAATQVNSVTLIGEQMQSLAPVLKADIESVFCAANHDQIKEYLFGLLKPGDLVIAKASNKFKLSDFLRNFSATVGTEL